MVAHGDALAQLAEAVLVEALAQFRLAHQNNLQQLAFIGFEIGQQADLFQQIVRQILRLVNDQHRIPALRHLFEQKMIYLGNRFETVQSFYIQPEFHADRPDQLIGVQRGIENQGGRKIFPQLIKQRAAQGRFARANFARQLDKTFSLADAVEEMIESLAMFGAVKKKSRIGRDVKRRFGQAVIFQIHSERLAHRNLGEKKNGLAVDALRRQGPSLRDGQEQIRARRSVLP